VPARDQLEARGTVIERVADGAYRVELPNGHKCIVRAPRGDETEYAPGAAVRVAFHPYDLSRGRIVLG
jgi:translation initiation factor IF-1